MTDPGVTQFTRVNILETLTINNIPVVGGGDVNGPNSSTDNAIVLWDGSTGKLIKDSSASLGDFVTSVTASTNITVGGSSTAPTVALNVQTSLDCNGNGIVDCFRIETAAITNTGTIGVTVNTSGQAIMSFENSADSLESQLFVTNTEPEGSLSANPGDVAIIINGASSNIAVLQSAAPGSSGWRKGVPEVSAIAPTNTDVDWLNSDDNVLYFYDGVNWVSYHEYEFIFWENGNAGNGVFFFGPGGIRTTASRGQPIPFDAKMISFSFSRDNTNTGTLDLTMGPVGGPFVAVGTCTIDTSTEGNDLALTAPVNLVGGETLSAEWNVGTGNTNDTTAIIRYRKVGA